MWLGPGAGNLLAEHFHEGKEGSPGSSPRKGQTQAQQAEEIALGEDRCDRCCRGRWKCILRAPLATPVGPVLILEDRLLLIGHWAGCGLEASEVNFCLGS